MVARGVGATSQKRMNPPRRWSRRGGVRFERFLLGFEGEFLPADTGFVHQAAFGHGEYRNAATVVGRGCCALGCRDGRCLCTELEFTGLEFIECGLVPEENDLTIALAAQLKTDGNLGEGC